MDYSKTVNLPQTDFPMKANLPQREPEFLARWAKEDLYACMQRKNAGRQKFILHDGPPYANGHIHLGTALNKILKDIIIKYKSMAGFDAPYTPGWDCHGLPIEQQCLKELKLDKHAVNMTTFRKQAAAFARKFIEIQKDEFKRLGVLADWENPYLTLTPAYESVIVSVFGDLAEQGYIYRQKKPVYWCPTCETALADAEVEYADHISHSIYVTFAVVKPPQAFPEAQGAAVLIWTTTPWTLPANTALAFQPAAVYVLVQATLQNGTAKKLILAKDRLAAVAEQLGASCAVLKSFDGSAAEGIICRNPLVPRDSVGILADFVSMEDGTGVVHIAPGHGQEDYQAGLKYNLPILSPVDDRGAFTDDVPGFAGHKVFAANHLIVEKLVAEGSVLREEKLTHSYPHCWRCKRAIIFRATPQWFMSVEHDQLRDRLKAAIKKVSWIPSYGENRIAGMLETRPDWCLSRQRLWGVPVPVFYCTACGEPLITAAVTTHIAALFAQHGSDIWFEKTADELLKPLQCSCAACKKTSFRKESDILDVWFDSGVSSEAVLASGNFPGLSLPADMYLEGSDQHRGWFQTSIIPAVALRGTPPYTTVLTHGFVVDGEGKKMSKSLGNTIAPQQIITQYGADILRLWVATSDYREDIRISPEILKGQVDAYRKIRNTLRFLLGNLADFSPKDVLPINRLRSLDHYAIHRLQDIIHQVNLAYDTYEFHRAAMTVTHFCTVFLSGFYLDALKDTLYCDAPSWESRRSAQSALWEIAHVLARLLAPVLSFTAEETWGFLRAKDATLPVSVFLASAPQPDPQRRLSDMENARWDDLLRIREKAMQGCEELRKDKKIGTNLGAHAHVVLSGQLDDQGRELLPLVVGTWDVSIENAVGSSQTLADTTVSVQPSALAKCDRCWRYVTDVADGLCPRCTAAVNELKV